MIHAHRPVRSTATGGPSGLRSSYRDAWRRAQLRRDTRGLGAVDDEGLSLVELLVAFAALIMLLTILASALTTYVTVGTNVVSSYQAADQNLPSSILIQRLIRSEVEPGPVPSTSGGVSATCPAINAPCPPFLTNSVGTFSTTFYANVGLAAGPAKIVMAATTPTKCAGCNYWASQFSVTQIAPNAGTCPDVTSGTACTWPATGKVLLTINGVVNPTTYKTNATPPSIFTYNTLDQYSTVYVPNDGGTPNAVTGILPGFATCAAPTLTNGNPTASNCNPDDVQSVGVDLSVYVPGTAVQENYFVVYRLSSDSFLYSPLVG